MLVAYNLWCTVTSGDEDVHAENLIDSELLFLDLLLTWGPLVDDAEIIIDQMLLQLMRQHALDWVHVVVSTDLSDFVSDGCVFNSWTKGSESCLDRLVCSQDDVSLSAGDLST